MPFINPKDNMIKPVGGTKNKVQRYKDEEEIKKISTANEVPAVDVGLKKTSGLSDVKAPSDFNFSQARLPAGAKVPNVPTSPRQGNKAAEEMARSAGQTPQEAATRQEILDRVARELLAGGNKPRDTSKEEELIRQQVEAQVGKDTANARARASRAGAALSGGQNAVESDLNRIAARDILSGIFATQQGARDERARDLQLGIGATQAATEQQAFEDIIKLLSEQEQQGTSAEAVSTDDARDAVQRDRNTGRLPDKPSAGQQQYFDENAPNLSSKGLVYIGTRQSSEGITDIYYDEANKKIVQNPR